MIKYKELVKKTMPPEKRESAKKCIIGHYLLRPVSNIVSIPFIEKKCNPTTVTKISGIFPIVALVSFLVWSGNFGFAIGWISMFVWNILDGVDGNIARFNDQCTVEGDLWDSLTGWLAIIAFYYGMGGVAYHNPGKIWGIMEYIPQETYLILGSLSAMCWIFPRLVMHKKANVYKNDGVLATMNRKSYGLIRLIVFNVTSINGLGAVLFLLAYLFEINALCMWGYFGVSMISCLACVYSLMKKKKDMGESYCR